MLSDQVVAVMKRLTPGRLAELLAEFAFMSWGKRFESFLRSKHPELFSPPVGERLGDPDE